MPAFRQALHCGRPIEPTGVSFEIPIGRKMVAGTFLRSTLPGDRRAGVPRPAGRLLRSSRAVLRAGQRLQGQLRAVRVLRPGRARSDHAARSGHRADSLPRLDVGPGAGVLENRILRRAALRFDRVAADDPQHRLPGQLLALGHGAHGHRLEVLQLAADGVLRQSQLPQERPGVRRRDQHRQPALRPGNPVAAAELRPGRHPVAPPGRPVRHHQRRRLQRVEPGRRSASRRPQLRRRARSPQASGPARRHCSARSGCRSSKVSRWWRWSGGWSIRKGSTSWPT